MSADNHSNDSAASSVLAGIRRAGVRTRLGSGPSARGLQADLSDRMSVRDRNLSVQEEPEVPASITAEASTHTRTHTLQTRANTSCYFQDLTFEHTADISRVTNNHRQVFFFDLQHKSTKVTGASPLSVAFRLEPWSSLRLAAR